MIKSQFKKLNYKINLFKINNLSEVSKPNQLKVIDIKLNFRDPFKVSKSPAKNFVLSSLNLAHKLALDENVAGIVNCPIDKNLLNKNNIGVTEYLAKKCSIKNNSEVMILINKKLMVSPITTHLDIKSVSKKINKKIIITKIKVIDNWFRGKFGKKPKIGILGLNPHNAELRKESEEIKYIIPAIKNLNKIKINLKGPLVSDTIFIKDYKNYDLIVGMYHDQILSPFKALFKFNAIKLNSWFEIYQNVSRSRCSKR